MAVMHVPGRQPTNWSDVPPESPIKDLLELRNRIDTGKRNAEIIEGRLVVSPKPVLWHELVCAYACALAGVPLYLLVDRFAKPLTVSLFSIPGSDGYTEVHAVPVGGKLDIPAPFDVTLDTTTLPVPRS